MTSRTLLLALHIAAVAGWLSRYGWTVLPEVTYSVYGERGSIDLVAWHADTRTLLTLLDEP